MFVDPWYSGRTQTILQIEKNMNEQTNLVNGKTHWKTCIKCGPSTDKTFVRYHQYKKTYWFSTISLYCVFNVWKHFERTKYTKWNKMANWDIKYKQAYRILFYFFFYLLKDDWEYNIEELLMRIEVWAMSYELWLNKMKICE